jgi:hypothetical protein
MPPLQPGWRSGYAFSLERSLQYNGSTDVKEEMRSAPANVGGTKLSLKESCPTMKRMMLAAAGLTLFLAGFAVARQKGKPRMAMYQAAQAFLTTLTSEQKSKANFPFHSEERFNWHFVPKERAGMRLKEMSATQREAALNLLKVSLSEKGLSKVETIRQLETVLHELENKNPIRDPEHYYISIFGEPTQKGPWGWRYEGHHVSLHWTVLEGKVIASTPQFFGANPSEVRQGPMKGVRALGAEEDIARALVKSLNARQSEDAILSKTAPPDILTGAQRKAAIQEDRGLTYARMNQQQQGMLLALIQEHAAAQPPALGKQRLDALRKAGLDTIKFAWMGSVEKGQGHYYRIQGSTFLIEYDNTQNDANHVHVVWRDFKGDFGEDLLEQHYKNAPHHQHD